MLSEVILVGSECLGSGDADLGRLLMGNMLRLLGQREDLPKYVILWNTGVLLAVEGATPLEYLKKLQDRGVTVICCQTCVDYFAIEGKIAAGEVDGMVRIIDILSNHHVTTIA